MMASSTKSAFDPESFRQRVSEFLAANAPDLPYRTGTRAPEDDHEDSVLRQWSSLIYENGFYGAQWPDAFGGDPSYDPDQDFIVTEEFAKVRAPVPIGAGPLASHALLAFGSTAQQDAYLPKIRSYEHVWCQLFSEPDAGSDLASMRTTAIRDGAVFVLNGQKVWSTNAFRSNMGFLLARTDPSVSKHAGISAFALDMTLAGIATRPLREMTGTSDFNEVFFDNVKIPASALIGELNNGWTIATDALASERAGVGALVIRLRQNLEELISLSKVTPRRNAMASQDALVRQKLAEFAIRVEIATLFSKASMQRRQTGTSRTMDVPLSKLTFANLNYDIAEYGIMLQGLSGTLAEDDPRAADHGHWQDELLYAKAYTISGGSNQIMQNLLSERALAMPRDPQ